MAIVINTNVASLTSQRSLASAQQSLAQSFNRLSSGYRINSSKDDAAGLAISESMKMQIRSYSVAERNANDGMSMVQTAEGALGQVTDLLSRMREIATQGANGVLTSTDRSYLSTEFMQLQNEIIRLQSSTKFNGKYLIGGPSQASNPVLRNALAAMQQAFDAVDPSTVRQAVENAYNLAGRPASGSEFDAYQSVQSLMEQSPPLENVTSREDAQTLLNWMPGYISSAQATMSTVTSAPATWNAAKIAMADLVAGAQTVQGSLGAVISAFQTPGADGNSPITFQIGIQNTAADRIVVSFGGINLMGITSESVGVGGSDGRSSQAALDAIDNALKSVSKARSRYGAVMNRFDVVVSNTQTAKVNIAAANSRIRDVDVADETAGLSRQQVLMQAGSSILAQANQAPQMALSLLR